MDGLYLFGEEIGNSDVGLFNDIFLIYEECTQQFCLPGYSRTKQQKAFSCFEIQSAFPACAVPWECWHSAPSQSHVWDVFPLPEAFFLL